METKKTDTLADLKKDVPFEVALGEKLIESKSTMAIWVGRSCEHCDSFVVYQSNIKRKWHLVYILGINIYSGGLVGRKQSYKPCATGE